MLQRSKSRGFLPAASPLSVEMGGEIEEEEDADEVEKRVEYERAKKSVLYFICVLIEGREKTKKLRTDAEKAERLLRWFYIGFLSLALLF